MKKKTNEIKYVNRLTSNKIINRLVDDGDAVVFKCQLCLEYDIIKLNFKITQVNNYKYVTTVSEDSEGKVNSRVIESNDFTITIIDEVYRIINEKDTNKYWFGILRKNVVRNLNRK